MEEQTRDEEIHSIWQANRFFYQILGGVALVVLLVIGGAIFGIKDDYVMNIFFSVVNVIATVFILDRLNERRAEQALKEQLKIDAGSISNEIAKNAVHQIKRKGWLTGKDGLLVDADLHRANLAEAYDLHVANLTGVDASRALLQDANLFRANLQCANLSEANLEGANLKEANLQNANLRRASLGGVKYNEKTILPDNTKENPKFWKPRTDMGRFTDPTHSSFWEPEWVRKENEEKKKAQA